MSKKSIIAIITIIVLLFAVGLSVGIFLYGRLETEATEGNQTTTTDQNQVSDGNQNIEGTLADGNIQDDENSENPITNSYVDAENTTSSNEGNVEESNDNQTIDNENNNNTVTNNNSNNNNNNNSANASVTTDTNVNQVGETTITRVEEQEKLVSKHFYDWWKPMVVKVNEPTAVGLATNMPQLTVEKIAKTYTGSEDFVYAGQEITYAITVANNGNESVENIEITDKIPANTTFVSMQDAKISDEAVGTKTTVESENIVVGVKWVVTIPAGEEVVAEFTVKVVATEGTITNIAVANGQESKDPTNDEDEGNETKTSVIKAYKTSVITRNGQQVETAKVDDLITYTITVENTGDVEGTTYISDTVPTGTEFYSVPDREGAIVSEAKDSIIWSITLGAKGSGKEKVTRQFTVKVTNINGTITNIAEVAETPTEQDTTETAGVTVKKEVVDIKRNGQSIGKTAEVKEKDIIEYKITVTNNGSKDLTNVVVNEKLANIVINQAELNIGELAAGDSRVINATYTVEYDTDIYKNEARLVNNEVEVTGKTKVNPDNPNEVPEDVKDDDKTETEIEKVSLIDINKKATAVLVKADNGFNRKEISENMAIKPTVRPGDVIEYVITIENKGNTVLENIKVTDILAVKVGSENATEKNAGSIIYEKDKLEPTEGAVEIKVYYTVTDTDADVTVQTFINNEVKVTATDSEEPKTPVEDTDKDDTVEVNPNVDISVSKVWNDNNNKHKIRPTTITINLLANGAKVAEKTISGTSYIFEDFPKYDDNKNEITYTVTENAVGGYEAITTGNMAAGYTITNTDKIAQTKTSEIKRLNTTTGQYDTITTAKVGDIIKYTITVINESNTAATVKITDILPAGSVTLLTTGLNVSGSTITWENQVVPAKGNLVITFEVQVKTVDLGTIQNIANVGDAETVPDQVKVEAYIIFEENGGTTVQDMTGIAGETITNTTMPTTTNTGYTFGGWYAEQSLTNKVDTLPSTYPAGTTIYYAKWVPAADTKYTVKHHLKDLNTNTYTLQEPAENLTGTTGELTQAVARTYTGFTAQPFNQEIIAADGSTVVDIYYNRDLYTVIYAPGTQGTFEAKDYTYENVEYGDTTPAFPGTPSGNAGYNFKKWDKEIAATVTEDVTYTAIWEGLQVTKKGTGIIDVSGSGNTSYVDQEGDIIKYTITVTNIGDETAEGIQVIDNLPVTVIAIKVAGNPITIQNLISFESYRNLLEGTVQNPTIQPGESIELTVQYTVTAQELVHALKEEDEKLENTAIAYLDEDIYTGTDEGTDVKGEPKIEISKSGSIHADAGGKIQYIITVKNTGYVGTNVTITDELKGTTYVDNSAKIENTAIEPTISMNNANQVLTWQNIYIEPLATENITFEVITPNDIFGEQIKNTANSSYQININGTIETINDTSNEVITKINEIHVVHQKITTGQQGTDLNIIFVLDNSSSMNYPIANKSYKYSSSAYPIAPTDESKTRIYNAKTAIKQFIDTQSQNNLNTSMSVITFNETSKGTEPDMMTLMNIEEKNIITETEEEWVLTFGGWVEREITKKYIEISGIKYRITDDKVTGSDGEKYYGVYIPIEYGSRFVGSNTTLTNEQLKTAVNNISISSEKSGFGTYISPAFKEINDNKNKYLSNTKKNIVIVLADGAFNGNYYSELQKLEGNVDEIYCIGFGSGSDYNATALANMSTNGVCYEADDADTLLDAFIQIEESASTPGYGYTILGEIPIDVGEVSDEVVVSTEHPLEVTYATGHLDTNGHHIMATLFTCTSSDLLDDYGITITTTNNKKQIIWNAKDFLAKNPNNIQAVPNTIYLQYYVSKNANN